MTASSRCGAAAPAAENIFADYFQTKERNFTRSDRAELDPALGSRADPRSRGVASYLY